MSANPNTHQPALDGLVVAGTAVILTGRAARCALQAALIAIRTRRTNGLPDSPAYRELAAALSHAQSANGHTDVPKHALQQHLYLEPTVPLPIAAQKMGIGNRHARRLAPRLGGRKIGGRWFVDEQALTEHLNGKSCNARPSENPSSGDHAGA